MTLAKTEKDPLKILINQKVQVCLPRNNSIAVFDQVWFCLITICVYNIYTCIQHLYIYVYLFFLYNIDLYIYIHMCILVFYKVEVGAKGSFSGLRRSVFRRQTKSSWYLDFHSGSTSSSQHSSELGPTDTLLQVRRHHTPDRCPAKKIIYFLLS